VKKEMSNGGGRKAKMKGKYTQNSLKRGGYWAVIACRLPYKEEKKYKC